MPLGLSLICGLRASPPKGGDDVVVSPHKASHGGLKDAQGLCPVHVFLWIKIALAMGGRTHA